jgi:alpha-tubulin suppressor-like RCC1 family protein
VDAGGNYVTSPRLVTGLEHVVELRAGYDHTCARLATGDVYCWGGNDFGQLGDGTTIWRYVPTRVLSLVD